MNNADASVDTSPAATLDAWRAQGEHRLDPVRFRWIEALARRATAHQGEARRLLDLRVAALLQAYGEALAQARDAKERAPAAPPQAEPGGLAALSALLAAQAASRGPAAAGTGSAPAPEIASLAYFRSTWSRLSADRRLTRSLETVPENAGPLNSHNLVHQALALMRTLSPEYLHRFMAYADTLLWLEQANGSTAPAGAEPARAKGEKADKADKAKKTARTGKARKAG